jgi:transcriptional regulator with XRE-family HTH domain
MRSILKTTREKKGLTQQQFADLVKVSRVLYRQEKNRHMGYPNAKKDGKIYLSPNLIQSF